MLQLDRLEGLGFSEPMINGIKTKAHKLVPGGRVTRAFSGDESRFLKSFSSNKPHLVQPHKHLGYQCEESCLQYKATKVCIISSYHHISYIFIYSRIFRVAWCS